MWDYSDKVMDHFLNPKNVGEVENADAVGEVGNISCGDALKLSLKLDDEKRITEAKFQTFGCASAIASSSALTELVIGMTLDEAEKVTNQDIVDVLGELPEEKIHCSVMGMEALHAAIASYRGEDIAHETHEDGVIVCHCFGVTDEKVRFHAKANGVRDAEKIQNYCKAGGACGGCLDKLQSILDEFWKKEEAAPEEPQELTFVQKVMKTQEIIEREIKPMLEMDGGSIELVDIVGNKVQVKLKGVCVQCPSSQVTLKNTVEAKLKEFVASDLEVEEIK